MSTTYTFPERHLCNTVVYWAAPISDGYGGFSWDDPVELEARWIQSYRIMKNHQGEEITAAVAVQVKIDVDQNGMMLLGLVDDLESDEYNDPVEAGALPIIRFDKIPNIKGDRYYRVAFLGAVYRGVDL